MTAAADFAAPAPSESKANGAHAAGPTDGPLRGLAHLAKVATLGHAQLVAETSQPIRWIWGGIVSEANHVEIAGPSGGGKTTFATLLAAALGNPGDPIALFGRVVAPVRAGQLVVIVEEENGKHSLRRKMETACTVQGLPVTATLDRMVFVIRRNVRVGDPVWADIVELGKRGSIGAIFIDSRARVLRNGDSNSEEDQAAVADAVFALIESSGAPAFIISHTRKGSASQIEDIAGSLQRGAGADVVLVIEAKRDASGRVLAATMTAIKIRDDVEEHPAPIEFTIGRDPGGQPCLSCTVPTEDTRPLEVRVLELLEREGPLTRSEVATKIGRSRAALQPVLDTLFAAERLRGARVRKSNGQEYAAIDVRRSRQHAENHSDSHSDEVSE
jgi:energy-coupling factor transporter ATP-binding protein EcfA2